MKKLFPLLAACALACSIAACAEAAPPANPPASSSASSSFAAPAAPESGLLESRVPESSQPEGSVPEGTPAPESQTEPVPEEGGGKALVAYFSQTGTTEGVANEIASQTGADVFEIVPAEAYTSDYNTLLDIAQRELGQNARPAITGSVEDIAQYDTIYLGWPCWWSDMPMVVCTFLDSYELSGKTIAPFVTSGGSGFGSALSRLQEMEPGAAVTEGLSLRGSGSAEEVSQWLNSIGLDG